MQGRESAAAGPGILLRGGMVVSPDVDPMCMRADVLLEGSRIAAVGSDLRVPKECRVLDVSGKFVLPGFVQTHVHLCQTLWRNHADDMGLFEWLTTRTWPLEAALDEHTIDVSARLGCAELLLGGTTTIADMGTVRHTSALVDAAVSMGMHGVFSRVLMDEHDGPEELRDEPEAALEEVLALADGLDARERNGLVRVALAPRFAPSCSRRLLEKVQQVARARGLLIHTHCSENIEENSLTVERFGLRPVELYERLGFLDTQCILAHCVEVSQDEIGHFAASSISVAHCPSANLKLGSGIAPVAEMLEKGVRVTLGADGAPCNNNLSMFREMRLAALLQKGMRHSPTSLPARRVFKMATLWGAEALGMGELVGSIAPGKVADLVVLDPCMPHSMPFDDPVSAIVYSMDERNVVHVLSSGRLVVQDGRLLSADLASLLQETDQAVRVLLSRTV